MYLEDVEDLAEWRSRPPIVVQGIQVLSRVVPAFHEWSPVELSDDDILTNISASLGI